MRGKKRSCRCAQDDRLELSPAEDVEPSRFPHARKPGIQRSSVTVSSDELLECFASQFQGLGGRTIGTYLLRSSKKRNQANNTSQGAVISKNRIAPLLFDGESVQVGKCDSTTFGQLIYRVTISGGPEAANIRFRHTGSHLAKLVPRPCYILPCPVEQVRRTANPKLVNPPTASAINW